MNMYVKQGGSSQTVGESKKPWRASLKSMRRKFGRDWMNPEMQTTLLNMYPPNLIATMLKALREQLKENDQLNAVEEIAGPATEIPLEYDQIGTEGGGFWDDVNGRYLPENIVLTARCGEIDEEIDWVHSEGVHENVPMQDCNDGSQKIVGADLGGHGRVCGSRSLDISIETVSQRKQDEEARQDSKSLTCFSVVLCNATT